MADKPITYIVTLTKSEVLSPETSELMIAKIDKLLKENIVACQSCSTEVTKLYVELAGDEKVMCKSCYLKMEDQCEQKEAGSEAEVRTTTGVS